MNTDRITEKIQKIRMIVLDVDGVLTDGRIIYGPDGHEVKEFDIQDGMGVTLARMGGLKVGIITGRTSDMVRRRMARNRPDAVLK